MSSRTTLHTVSCTTILHTVSGTTTLHTVSGTTTLHTYYHTNTPPTTWLPLPYQHTYNHTNTPTTIPTHLLPYQHTSCYYANTPPSYMPLGSSPLPWQWSSGRGQGRWLQARPSVTCLSRERMASQAWWAGRPGCSCGDGSTRWVQGTSCHPGSSQCHPTGALCSSGESWRPIDGSVKQHREKHEEDTLKREVTVDS